MSPHRSIFRFAHWSWSAIQNQLLFLKLEINQIKIGGFIMNKTGHIELILGPMFSGKSSEMQRKVRRYQHAHKDCLVINYVRDNRYSFEDVAATHDKVTIRALKAGKLKDARSKALEHDVVAIDEGQFFDDIVQEAEFLANAGKVVIIAALDGTFQRKPFGKILSLVPMAEYVTKLSAVCIDCGKEAAFTRRTIDCQEIELIGGSQTYKPVCRDCFGVNKPAANSQSTAMAVQIQSIRQTTEMVSKITISE